MIGRRVAQNKAPTIFSRKKNLESSEQTSKRDSSHRRKNFTPTFFPENETDAKKRQNFRNESEEMSSENILRWRPIWQKTNSSRKSRRRRNLKPIFFVKWDRCRNCCCYATKKSFVLSLSHVLGDCRATTKERYLG